MFNINSDSKLEMFILLTVNYVQVKLHIRHLKKANRTHTHTHPNKSNV